MLQCSPEILRATILQMSGYKTLPRGSLSFLEFALQGRKNQPFSSVVSFQPSPSLSLSPVLCRTYFQGLHPRKPRRWLFSSAQAALPTEPGGCVPDAQDDTVEHLLKNPNDISRLMKMERKIDNQWDESKRWFPYLDRFKCVGETYLSSTEVLEAVGPHIMEVRKERFRGVIRNRSYSVCLVVEGLTDFGNVSATFRSADALGFQSVHVISCDSSKRYRDNRHVSKGAEKWLDIELWNSPEECFTVLKSRGYRIATTHVGMDAVSIYNMDWSCPTAIVVGNENRGISDEALALSDLHCSIPMKGMVDSFNVSVAAAILMHHAVCDRTARLGSHGDLTSEESRILLAEFSLRHSQSAISIANEHAKRKISMPAARL